MIVNKWKKYIDRKGISQAELSRQTGVYAAIISYTVNGMAHPPTKEEAERMCDALGCKLTDVYSADTIKFLYDIEVPQPKPRKRKPDTRVRIDPSVHSVLTEHAEKAGMELPIYVNRILIKEAARHANAAGSGE